MNEKTNRITERIEQVRRDLRRKRPLDQRTEAVRRRVGELRQSGGNDLPAGSGEENAAGGRISRNG